MGPFPEAWQIGSFPTVGVNEQQRCCSVKRGEAGSDAEGGKLIVCGRLQVTVDGPTSAPASDDRAVQVGSCRGGAMSQHNRCCLEAAVPGWSRPLGSSQPLLEATLLTTRYLSPLAQLAQVQELPTSKLEPSTLM